MSMIDEDDFLTGEEADAIFGQIDGQSDEKRLAEAKAAVMLSSHDTWMGAIAVLEEGLAADAIPEPEIEKLIAAIPSHLFQIDEVDAEFDMKKELGEQRALVTALRNKVMVAGGRSLQKGVTIQEAKSVMDTCRQFGAEIRKNMESVVNLDRIQALEAAILATVSGYDEEMKRDFLKNLEKQLAIFCKQD